MTTGENLEVPATIVLTVGSDCAIGKMTVATRARPRGAAARHRIRVRPDGPDRHRDRRLGHRGRRRRRRLHRRRRRAARRRGPPPRRRAADRRGAGLAPPPAVLGRHARPLPRHPRRTRSSSATWPASDSSRTTSGSRSRRCAELVELHERIGADRAAGAGRLHRAEHAGARRRRRAARDRRRRGRDAACRRTTRSASAPSGSSTPSLAIRSHLSYKWVARPCRMSGAMRDKGLVAPRDEELAVLKFPLLLVALVALASVGGSSASPTASPLGPLRLRRRRHRGPDARLRRRRRHAVPPDDVVRARRDPDVRGLRADRAGGPPAGGAARAGHPRGDRGRRPRHSLDLARSQHRRDRRAERRAQVRRRTRPSSRARSRRSPTSSSATSRTSAISGSRRTTRTARSPPRPRTRLRSPRATTRSRLSMRTST